MGMIRGCAQKKGVDPGPLLEHRILQMLHLCHFKLAKISIKYLSFTFTIKHTHILVKSPYFSNSNPALIDRL
jgi:hypothetical protein